MCTGQQSCVCGGDGVGAAHTPPQATQGRYVLRDTLAFPFSLSASEFPVLLHIPFYIVTLNNTQTATEINRDDQYILIRIS